MFRIGLRSCSDGVLRKLRLHWFSESQGIPCARDVASILGKTPSEVHARVARACQNRSETRASVKNSRPNVAKTCKSMWSDNSGVQRKPALA
eukprot:1514805-Pyramimonas_sp.AAC.1